MERRWITMDCFLAGPGLGLGLDVFPAVASVDRLRVKEPCLDSKYLPLGVLGVLGALDPSGGVEGGVAATSANDCSDGGGVVAATLAYDGADGAVAGPGAALAWIGGNDDVDSASERDTSTTDDDSGAPCSDFVTDEYVCGFSSIAFGVGEAAGFSVFAVALSIRGYASTIKQPSPVATEIPPNWQITIISASRHFPTPRRFPSVTNHIVHARVRNIDCCVHHQLAPSSTAARQLALNRLASLSHEFSFVDGSACTEAGWRL